MHNPIKELVDRLTDLIDANEDLLSPEAAAAMIEVRRFIIALTIVPHQLMDLATAMDKENASTLAWRLDLLAWDLNHVVAMNASSIMDACLESFPLSSEASND